MLGILVFLVACVLVVLVAGPAMFWTILFWGVVACGVLVGLFVIFAVLDFLEEVSDSPPLNVLTKEEIAAKQKMNHDVRFDDRSYRTVTVNGWGYKVAPEDRESLKVANPGGWRFFFPWC